MRFMRLQTGSTRSLAVEHLGRTYLLNDALDGVLRKRGVQHADPSDLKNFLRLDADDQREVLTTALSAEGAVSATHGALIAPMEPDLIICSGENYWDHRDEKPRVNRTDPEFFLKSHISIAGPSQPVRLDHAVTKKLDYEVELLVVIGRAGRHISREDALDHVFGYSIMNDLTARDRQVHLRADGTAAYNLGPGKSFDTSASIGPVVVTADEIGDPQNLAIRSRVNGELRQDNHTSRMIWDVATLVSYFSTFLTLKPGVVISTGTPGGTAWGSDPELGARGRGAAPEVGNRYLRADDVVECEVEKIGVLSNTVVQPA